MIGKTLGNFECTALPGNGGRGKVSRAKNQRQKTSIRHFLFFESMSANASMRVCFVARFIGIAMIALWLLESSAAAETSNAMADYSSDSQYLQHVPYPLGH